MSDKQDDKFVQQLESDQSEYNTNRMAQYNMLDDDYIDSNENSTPHEKIVRPGSAIVEQNQGLKGKEK